MKRFVTLSLVILLGLVNMAHAGSDSDTNNCMKLVVTITNNTDQACTLANQYLKHGYLAYTSSIPAFIPAHSTAHPFFLTQSWLIGPELELTYNCGEGKSVNFTTKQDACYLAAGNVYGKNINSNAVNLQHQATPGSIIWSQHGSMTWIIG